MDKSPEERRPNDPPDEECVQSIAARILARRGTVLGSTEGQDYFWDAGMPEGEARAGTQRIQSRRSDREDIFEVKYHQIRLERVVFTGLRITQSEEEVDTPLRELIVLAETAGSQVLDTVVQKHVKPDPATYLGSGKAKEPVDIARSVETDTVIADEEPTSS